MEDTRKVDIIIVGAGISGLTCARELCKYSKNINLTLLEASDRIGGRVKSIVADDGTILELGAQYIHGTIKNPIYDFAVKKNIIAEAEDKEWEPYSIFNCFHKKVLSSCSLEDRLQAINIADDTHEEAMQKQRYFTKKEFETYKTVGTWVDQNFQAKLDEFEGQPQFCVALKSAFMLRYMMECSYSGCASLYDLDQEGFENFIDFAGDFLYTMDNKRYDEVVSAIAEDILIDCIKFGEEVEKIENISRESESKMKLTTGNGDVYFADAVVCTMSIEVMKHFMKTNVFSPPFHPHKVAVIEKLCLAQVTKLYFKFIKLFDKSYDYFYFYPATDDYGKRTYNKMSQLISFDRVANSNWWIFLLMGDLVTDCENNGPDIFFRKLIETIKEEYPEFPNLEVDYSSIVISDWNTNPLFRGTYSFLKPDSTVEDINTLGEPIYYNRTKTVGLLFAGEMTHAQYYSTTHAAYLSGIREARRVESMYNLQE